MNALGSPAIILILEDQGLVRAGMRELIQICEPRGQIHEAASYDEAVRKLGERDFSIAFLDIDLKSEKTGVDVLKYLRSAEKPTRAIMLSGRGERELVMECLNLGASGYILKDMDEDGLFRKALDTVFQGGIFLPATVFSKGSFSPASAATHRVSAESVGISGRPLEVLYFLCQGLSNKEIANRMDLEEGTVRKDYVPRLFRHFNVSRRTALLVEISRRGIVVPKPPKTE